MAAPSIVVGFGMAETLGARVFGLRSRLEQVRAFDDAMFRELAQLYELDRVLVLRESTGSLPTLSVVGSIPPGLNLGGLRDQLRSEIKVTWRALSESKDIYDNAAYLELPRVALEHRAAVALGDPGIVHWEEQLEPALARRVVELTEVLPGRFRQPSIEQLRVFGQAVFPGFVDLDRSGTEPGPWQRALAAQLGYRFAKLAKGSAWALHEPASKARQGNATFMLRTGASDRRAPLLVEVPAPRWEAGAVDAAIAVGRAVDSQALLIAGSMPSVDAKGRADVRRVRGARSYYQHAHEIWIQQGGRAVALHGVSPARPTASDVVATFGDPTQTPFAGPSWTRPIVRALVNNGLSVVSVDGSYETEAFEGSTNPAFAFAKRFGDRQMMLLWMTSEARARFLKIRPDEVTEGRVNRLRQLEGLPETLGHAQAMASCLGLAQSAMPGASRDSCSSATGTRVCDSENVVRRLLAYNGTRNPYQLTAALSQPACRVDITRDTRSQRIWALVTGPAALELVPLRTGATARAARGLSDLTEIRQALALGLSTVRIGGGP